MLADETETSTTQIQITFSQKAYLKTKALCEIAKDNEWIAYLIVDSKRGDITIEDLLIPNQKINSGSAIIDNDTFSMTIAQIAKDQPELLNKVRGIIHSHNNMSAYFSMTDDTMNGGLAQFTKDNSFFISIVVNNEMEMKSKAMIKLNGFTFEIENIPIYIDYDTKSVRSELAKEFSAKAKIIQYAPSTTYYNDGWTYYQPPRQKETLEIIEIPTYTILDKKEIEWIIKMYCSKPSGLDYSTEQALEALAKRHDMNKTQKQDARRIIKAFFISSDMSFESLRNLTQIDIKEYRKRRNAENTERKDIDRKDFKGFKNKVEWYQHVLGRYDLTDEDTLEELFYRGEPEEDCYRWE